MHWHHRPFTDARDAGALLDVIRRRPDAAHSDPLTLAEMQERLQLPQTLASIHLWVQSDDTVLGYACLNPSNYLFFETIDVPQRAVLEVEMMQWAEAQLHRTTQAAEQALILA